MIDILKTKLLSSSLILFLFLGFYFYEKEVPPYFFEGEKMKGLSMVAPPKEVSDTCLTAILNVKANWVSLMPYAFVPKESATVRFQIDSSKNHQWWGESPAGIRKCIRMAKSKGIKVMLKPHLWLGWGQFTGEMDFDTEDQWREFERSYKLYMLTFGKIAQEEGVESFCLGTEMGSHVQNRPAFWLDMITEMRKIYKGKLTYAENWDCFDKVSFWNQLDFIGVDGYFPLSDKKDPSENDLKKGWIKHLKKLNNISGELNKPILFTEIGYRSNDYSTEKPWDTEYSKPINDGLQAKAYAAFFENAYKQPWCAGAFIWKWFPVQIEHFHEKETFSPQGKPAEAVLKTYFSK